MNVVLLMVYLNGIINNFSTWEAVPYLIVTYYLLNYLRLLEDIIILSSFYQKCVWINFTLSGDYGGFRLTKFYLRISKLTRAVIIFFIMGENALRKMAALIIRAVYDSGPECNKSNKNCPLFMGFIL